MWRGKVPPGVTVFMKFSLTSEVVKTHHGDLVTTSPLQGFILHTVLLPWVCSVPEACIDISNVDVYHDEIERGNLQKRQADQRQWLAEKSKHLCNRKY